MTMPAMLVNWNSRFNAMSLRERALVAAAALALLVLGWDQMLMDPLRVEKQRLTEELEQTQKSIISLSENIEGRATDNPLLQAIRQQKTLTDSLAAVDGELQSTSAGLIAPPRMVDALRDVLARQDSLRLVSVRNLPVTSLVPPSAQPSAPGDASATAAQMQGPYVHSLELVVEGSYLDVLHYLQAVEELPWRFYWQALELKSVEYPMNRVRIRLNTLSMDREWLGV